MTTARIHRDHVLARLMQRSAIYPVDGKVILLAELTEAEFDEIAAAGDETEDDEPDSTEDDDA